MSYIFESRLGKQLHRLLPEVYRTSPELYRRAPGRPKGYVSDKNHVDDLAKYLDAHGHLLDLIHATLEQQLDDVIPESSQDWLLPYFAQLLAVNIVSPESDGRHAEIANAVSWRQRKGTLGCVEEIAESVGQMEVEIQEGWQRVAMTPRVGMVKMPSSARDSELHLDMQVVADAIRHPDLPAVMVDIRRASRAVKADRSNPGAKLTRFGGVHHYWRQENHHGVPCSPGSFDDVSARTVDMRTPTTSQGHYHPKRLLAYSPPPVGFFTLAPITLEWEKRKEKKYELLFEEKEEKGVVIIRNLSSRRVVIVDDASLIPAGHYRIEGIHFNKKLTSANGGRVELNKVEATEVVVDTFSTDEPVLTAADCLFGTLKVGSGLAELEQCTVLEGATLTTLHARNCIFNTIAGNDISGEISFSRIPDSFSQDEDSLLLKECTSDTPEFFQDQTELSSRAALAPNCPKSISGGADDGGEMGHFHRGREENPVVITGNFTGSKKLKLEGDATYPLRDMVFTGSVEVDNGRLFLVRTAILSLQVNRSLGRDGSGQVIPALDAKDCLFDTLRAGSGLVRLEHCTVMKEADCKHLQASDCIFADTIINVKKSGVSNGVPVVVNCIRYSSIRPVRFSQETLRALRLIEETGTFKLGTNTSAAPTFIHFSFCHDKKLQMRATLYGEPGYGILSIATPDAIRFGAEDGGEMGGYHHRFYSLRQEATLEKMREFLPVGIEPVLIQDARLLYVWPELLAAEDPT